MSAAAGILVEELGRALREVRWRLRVSQRELAEQLGVSKSWVGRVESGEVSAALAVVSRVAADLGLSVTLAPQEGRAVPVDGALDPGERPEPSSRAGRPARPDEPAPCPPPPGRTADWSPPFDDDPDASALVQRWRERTEREGVRDAVGRRMPAHLVGYPMSYPHHWWFLRHRLWSLTKRPIWSFTFRRPTAAAVLRVGDNPPPLGLHPSGGWPLQGRPSEEVRQEWPPTFPVRPRWYPPPLSGS